MIIEFTLAMMTSKYGHRVSILLDSGLLRHHDSEHLVDEDRAPRTNAALVKCKKIILLRLIGLLARLANIDLIFLSKIEDAENLELSPHEKNHVISSCKRYSSNPKFLAEIEDQTYYRDSEYNARLLRANIVRLHEKFRWDTVVSSHGVYVTWGIIHDYLGSRGANTRVYLNCIYETGSLWISKNASQKVFLEYSPKSELPDHGYNRLRKRLRYESPDTQIYFKGERVDINSRRLEHGITFGLFPNIIWDGAIIERDRVFSGLLDWMLTTINTLRGSENKLVIRFHPAESTLTQWAESLEEIVVGLVPDLYQIPNIMVIHSDENIDLYGLIREKIDVGLVYDGILGLEITELNKPVVCVANTRYMRAGFCFEVRDKISYEKVLLGKEDLTNWFNENRKVIKSNLRDYSNAYLGSDLYKLALYEANYWDVNLRYEREAYDPVNPDNVSLYNRLSGLA